MKFSVLMSVYYKENAKFFNRAMISIWDEQIVKPNEIVLVEDGKLTVELYASIKQWQNKLGTIFKTIPLEENIGLGDALNIGIKECSYELIARMDTDDIALKDRFEKQLKIFEDSDVDICSSWVSEFEDNENKIVSYRKVPELHVDIIKFSKLRCPVNHPAVMYKKSIVQKTGGYKKMMWFEDYYLWARMILNGAKFYNIQEPLVSMRAGYNQLERRKGLKYAMSELALQRIFYNLKFINSYEFILNIIIRLVTRILPKIIVKLIYKMIRNNL
jgi:glycosyltransferase involved in cell wall biosynthesis